MNWMPLANAWPMKPVEYYGDLELTVQEKKTGGRMIRRSIWRYELVKDQITPVFLNVRKTEKVIAWRMPTEPYHG